jgi:hypothetical protein
VRRFAIGVVIMTYGCAGGIPSTKDSLPGQPNPDAVISFSRAQKGDTLWVRSWSAGCFGVYDRIEITMLGRKPDVAGVVYERGAVILKTDTKTVSLAASDRARLDSLLASCRTAPVGALGTGAMGIEFSMSRHGRKHPPMYFRSPRLRWGDYEILYSIADRKAL